MCQNRCQTSANSKSQLGEIIKVGRQRVEFSVKVSKPSYQNQSEIAKLSIMEKYQNTK
jgi:hypothetical protein